MGRRVRWGRQGHGEEGKVEEAGTWGGGRDMGRRQGHGEEGKVEEAGTWGGG